MSVPQWGDDDCMLYDENKRYKFSVGMLDKLLRAGFYSNKLELSSIRPTADGHTWEGDIGICAAARCPSCGERTHPRPSRCRCVHPRALCGELITIGQALNRELLPPRPEDPQEDTPYPNNVWLHENCDAAVYAAYASNG